MIFLCCDDDGVKKSEWKKIEQLSIDNDLSDEEMFWKNWEHLAWIFYEPMILYYYDDDYKKSG